MRSILLLALLPACSSCQEPPDEYTAEVHMGSSHACLRSNEGRVSCHMYEARDESEDLPQPRSHYAQVTIKGYDPCGLTDDGEVECWGKNSGGRNDDIPPGPFVAIESGSWENCALRADGSAACWGTGDGSATRPPADEPLVQIAGGSRRS